VANNQNSRSREARNRYRRGRAFEYKVRDWYQSRGCFVVRAAGSHTPADLIVLPPSGGPLRWDFGPHIPILVQCKTDGKLSQTDRNRLNELCETYDCRAVLCSRDLDGGILEEEIY
jgi:hypothetical protein